MRIHRFREGPPERLFFTVFLKFLWHMSLEPKKSVNTDTLRIHSILGTFFYDSVSFEFSYMA